MSSDESNKKDINAPKRVFRPNSIPVVYSSEGYPEDHNLFIAVTSLKTGEIIYLDRIKFNTNDRIREQHYRVRSGRIYFFPDPLGEADPVVTSALRLGLNDATDRYLALDLAPSYPHYIFYYTGSEPIGYSFPDVNITVFIATDEEEKAWNIPPHVPRGNRRYYFWDKDAVEENAEGASASKDKRKGEGEEKRVYEPRPPFAAASGLHVMERWKDGREKHDREKQDKKCVIS